MIKEIGVGCGLGVLGALLWMGYNVYPVLLLLGLLFFLYKLVQVRGGGLPRFSPLKIENSKGPGLKISFDDIGGQGSAKRELLEALDFAGEPDQAKGMGIRPLKGILLAGPPGTGKTLLAKAAASYTRSAFIHAAGSEFIEMYAGVGAQRVRQLFQKARSSAVKKKMNSAVIFIDEIEVLGGKRGGHSSHLEYDQTLNQLLIELDGLDSGNGSNQENNVRLMVIGATNRADLLDSALLRPGRFDRIVNVELPDLEGRLQVLKIHTRNKPLAEDVSVEDIATETFGFSGAHLESVANEAAIIAFREKARFLQKKHFQEAIDKVMMGEKLDRQPDKEERKRIAVHETGHALVSESIRPGSVSTVTIIPRGKAMGYMRQVPGKDNYIYTREHLENQIAILLGGAICEEEVLGSRSTGAAGDFQQAVDLAKKIVYSGMSSLGVVSSEDIPAADLQKGLKEIISAQEKRVIFLIKKYCDVIDRVVDCLLTEERISGGRLRKMLCEREKTEA